MSNAELRIQKSFRKALTDYHLIEDGDHILVGLSGGKDSLLLLEQLAKRSRILKPRFKVEAIHVRMDNIPYETDTTYLERFCGNLGVPLHIKTTRFSTTPPDDSAHTGKTATKSPCYLCSWYRRKEMFRLAQELGCNKIALGHHHDDMIHTALMNVIFEGRFSSMPISLKMDKMPLTIIRPLALCHEADIKSYAAEQQYEKQLKYCPYEHETRRSAVADLFRQIEEMNPEARYSIFHALKSAGKLLEP